jgi:hypothetical protein
MSQIDRIQEYVDSFMESGFSKHEKLSKIVEKADKKAQMQLFVLEKAYNLSF